MGLELHGWGPGMGPALSAAACWSTQASLPVCSEETAVLQVALMRPLDHIASANQPHQAPNPTQCVISPRAKAVRSPAQIPVLAAGCKGEKPHCVTVSTTGKGNVSLPVLPRMTTSHSETTEDEQPSHREKVHLGSAAEGRLLGARCLCRWETHPSSARSSFQTEAAG
ncbi:hypothetical protein H1C71_033188 [Ictidomys tridecemlineatus]|nr:hypothetical protein H1C71_033188 [Ictidomys tridecemlineatus]